METPEGQVVAQSGMPVTVSSLAEDLRRLGVKPGLTLLVHSSLSKLGWVCGGPVAVILALLQTLGKDGTLVMPTHSGDLSDPKQWRNPPVPESWWPMIYESMPAFQADLTPTRGMGAIPEAFRGMRGVLRSDHPQVSFAAFGPQAEFITAGHSLAHGMGEQSPLARLYDADGWVLLLGVGHGSNTSLHLAETRAQFSHKKIVKNGSPVMADGARVWAVYEEVNYDESDFPRLGADFGGESAAEIVGLVGQAEAHLMPQRALVDYAVEWMEKNRK